MKKNLVVEGSAYSLLLFFLVEQNIDNVIFLLNRAIPLKICSNLEELYDKKNVYVVEKMNLKSDKSLKNKVKNIKEIVKFLIYIIKIFKGKKYLDKYYMKTGIFISYPFIRTSNNILEEGKNKPYYLDENWKNKLINNKKYIENIYLTKTSEKISNYKIREIDLLELWKRKSAIEKNKILKIFNYEEKMIKELKKKKTILLTQPLDKYGIEEKEKMKIYMKLLENINEEEIVIKSHPREESDYKKFFPNVMVIDGEIVIEILYLLGVEFENIITLFSSAALNIKGKNLYYYGTEKFEILEQKFGEIKGYIKINK